MEGIEIKNSEAVGVLDRQENILGRRGKIGEAELVLKTMFDEKGEALGRIISDPNFKGSEDRDY